MKIVTAAQMRELDRRAIGKEEAGSVARVLKVLPDSDRVIVEGVNYVYRHVRRSQKHPQGGRVAKEAPIHISNVLLYMEHTFAGTIGRYVTIQDTLQIYIAISLVAFAAVIVSSSIRETKFGLGLLSIKGDEDAASASGVNTTLYKLIAFGVTAMFMGMAGAAVIPRLGYVDNTIAFSSRISFNTLVMGVLGGAGSVAGGTVSAVVLSLLFEIFFSSAEPFPFLIALGVVLFVAIFFMPGGLAQLFSRISRRIGRARSTESGASVTQATRT
jgi:ribosomal protein L24